MKTLNYTKKTVNKRATDPFDILILENGLKAADLLIYPKLDLMIVVLNTGKTINSKISDYLKLKNASEKQLLKWTKIDDGTGFHWEELDEDLSLKGFIKTDAYNNALQNLSNKKPKFVFA